MRGLGPTLLATVVLAVACGGPLDRRDGALRLRLHAASDDASEIRVRVQTDERAFTAHVPRPDDDVISDFSAIPAGMATVDVELFQGVAAIDTRQGLKALIEEGKTTDLVVSFAPLPELSVDLAERHHPGDGNVPLFIRLNDESREVTISLRANEREVPTTPNATGWFAEIDPSWAGDALPNPIAVSIHACPANQSPDCAEWIGSVVIDRRSWTVRLDGATTGRPGYAPTLEAILVADDTGRLHAFSAGADEPTARPLQSPVLLPSPVQRPVAVMGGLAVVVPENGSVVAVSLTDGPGWAAHPSPAPSTHPVSDGLRLIIGTGRDLLEIDPNTGDVQAIARTPGPLRSTPWVDASGIVVVDVSGHVLALSSDNSVVFEASVDGFVEAPPLRYGGRTIVATLAGRVHHFDASGLQVGPVADLGAPVVHPPTRTGEATVIAAGDLVVFFTDEGRVTVRTERAITGAPTPWVDGRSVVVGLQNGSVLLVSPDGTRKRISRIDGAARSPRVLTDPPRIVVAGSRGDLEMLRVEADF